ncbi:MAG: chorismate mutase, partial [Acidimicrobiia bacterium]|nr:chorismate mutase [Acidimicrobiia bacterium]
MADEQLETYRSSIDNIDAALILLLAERFKVTKAVGEYKAAAGLPPADPDREKVQIARLRRLAEEANL